MKQNIFVIAMMLLGATFFACGDTATETEDQTTTEETTQDATEQTVEDAAQVTESAEGQGPEYTAAYQCPMHCEGSGSDQPGNCPVCGMAYVAKADLEKQQTPPPGQLTVPQEEADHDH